MKEGMKMRKKFLSVAVILSIISTMFCAISVSAMTAQEGAQWALDRIGWEIDTDGAWGYQCKDFVNAYIQENWGFTPPGHAINLKDYNYPSGWQKIQNTPDFLPQPGDIAVWAYGSYSTYGHCGVITSANLSTFTSVDQNWFNANGETGSPAALVTHNYNGFWGVIRPPFSSAAPSVQPIHYDTNAHVRNGFFTLKNAHSGTFMNVWGGSDSNGTAITTYSFDGSADQRFNIVHKGNGKYKLYAECSSSGSNRVVDVLRNNQALAQGQRVDLYDANDDTAQLFYLVPMNDGTYVIEIAAKDGYCIAPENASVAGSNSKDSQLTLQQYTGAAHQKWKLCNNNSKETTPNVQYAAGTYYIDTDGDSMNMRSGAGTSNGKVGSIPDKTTVNVTKVSGNWGYTTYNGVSGWFCLDFAVYKVTLSSISISSKPTKTNYFVGEKFDVSGLKITANYSNGTTEAIGSGYTVNADTSSAGTKTVTVSYKGKTTSFTINVNNITVSNIKINNAAKKNIYYVGDKLDTTGLSLLVTYNNNSSDVVSSGFTTSCDLSTSGTKTVTVNYGGKSTTYTVTVQDVKISNLALKTKPTKTEYYVGDTIDTSGLELTATYNNGSTKTITSGFTTSYDFGTAGTKKVTVNYSGLSVTYDVTVENIGSASLETSLTSTAVKGSEVIYTVDLKSAENIYDGNYNIIYDNTVLKYKSHTVGTVLTGQNCVVNPEYSENSIRTTFAGTSALKTGNMLSIIFEVVADTETTTQVKLQNVNMYNRNGKAVSVSDSGLIANCSIGKKIQETVAVPTANVNEGAVASGSTITLSTTTEGADIYYTTDGSTPTTSSLKYTEPIKITGEVTIKAFAVKTGMTNSGIATFAYTILDENKTTFKLATVNGKAGDTVEVALDVTNKTNIAGIIFKLSYDEGITLTEITEGDALSKLTFTPPQNISNNPCTLLWDGVDGDSTSGTLLRLKFKINEDAAEGDYNIKLTCTDGDIYDNDMNDIDVTIVNGKITIKEFTLGDLNDDGKINGKDVTLLRRYILGDYDVTINTNAADVNKDGKINGKDVTLLRRYILGDYGVTFE